MFSPLKRKIYIDTANIEETKVSGGENMATQGLPLASIKRVIKAAGGANMRVSANATDAFNKKCAEMAKKSCQIAKANNRSTVQAKDIAYL